VNLGVAIARNARHSPESTAVFEGDRELTYRDLDERTSRLANALIDRYKINRSDRVALLVHNRAEVIEVLGGCAKAGATYVGLNFRLKEPEYLDILDNADPRVLITEPEYAELATRLADERDLEVLMIDDPGDEGYENVLAAAPPDQPATLHQIRPEDDFAIVYTSGTTGRPKGVHFDVRAAVQHGTVVALEYDIKPESRWLMALPHNSSVNITFVPFLLMGGSVGFFDMRKFDAHLFAAEVRRHQATHTYLVPTMLFRLLDSGIEPTEIPTLHTIGYGAAPTPPDRIRELVERFGTRFIQLYGMAEVASVCTMLRKQDHQRAIDGNARLFSSAGRASWTQDVRVVDEAGNDLPPGQRGEVIFGSPYMMKGYFRDPERTGESLINGWMHSGDIGMWDQEGYLYIVDRKKDLIISGGFNIVPSEIEAVLYAHPSVLEASVFGVPDLEWGERVAAAVALKRGATAETEQLLQTCRDAGLSSLMVPCRIEILDALPKNAVGKLDKRALRDLLVQLPT
jgi:acyl-CoA synthetase (AMP-forming)/AMP-acid ligase II